MAGVAGSGSGNTISNTIEATIENGSKVDSIGLLSLAATDHSSITAGAGSLSFTVAGGQGGGFAGSIGVAAAANEIDNTVTAAIEAATANSAGGVDVSATNSSTILVVTVAGAAAGAGGEVGGVAFAGAGAGSGNTIGNVTQALINQDSTVTTTNGDVTMSAADNSSITADGGGLTLAGAFGQGGGVGVSIGAAVAINNIGNTVTATIDGSTVKSAGGVSVDAGSDASILAVAVGIAGALAGGQGGGIALAGAGSGSGNTISNTIEATIQNGSQVTSAGLLTVSATDNSSITAGAGSLTIAVAGGQGGGFAGSIGVAAASNEIDNNVTAAIENAKADSAGGVDVSATNSSKILVVTVAGGASGAGGQGGGLAFAGAGAGSGNTIGNVTQAFVNQNSTVTTTKGDVLINATDSSSITADGGGASLAGAGGMGGGVAVAIGAGVAVNTISNVAYAYVDDATVNSAGKVTVSATSTSQIFVVALGVAIAVSGGAGFGISASGSGASATNTIKNKIATYVTNGAKVSAAAAGLDAVSLTALDSSSISSHAYSAGVAVGIAPVGLALAAGVIVADNEIANVVQSYVGALTGTDTSSVTSTGGVQILATSIATIESDGVAVNAAVSVVGLAGSAASALNNTDSTVAAFVQNGGTVQANSAVQIVATDSPNIDSTIGTAAISAAVVAFSMGLSLNNSTIDDQVSAYIANSSVTTNGGAVAISALSAATIGGDTVATSVALGIGGALAGGESTSIDNIVTKAYLAPGANVNTNGGQLNINATSTPQISAKAEGGSGGLVSIGVMVSIATLNGSTSAFIGEGVTVNAGGVDVSALSQNGSTDAVNATTTLVNIGGVTLSVVSATATIDDTVESYIGAQAQATATNDPTVIKVTGLGTLQIDANSTTTASVSSPGGSLAGSLSVSGTAMNVNVDGETNAYIGAGKVTLNVPTVLVQAQSNNGGATDAVVVGVASIAGNFAVVDAENSHNVSAYIAGGAKLQVSGALTVQSKSQESANAKLDGGNGGLIAVAVLDNSATVSGTTQAYIAAGANVTAGSLTVNTDVQAANAGTDSRWVQIALGAGAGSDSTATVSGSALAYLGGPGTVLNISGPIVVNATSASSPSVVATVGSGGILSAAGATATSIDSETTEAYLAAGQVLAISGDVTFSASATATPTINVTVGSGGVISGGGATSTITDDAITQAFLDPGSSIGSAAHPAGNVTVTATSIDQGNNTVDVGSGGILSGNGTTVQTTIDPTIKAFVDTNAKVYSSGTVDVIATSTRAEGHASGSSTSIGGVVVGIPNAEADTAPAISSYLAKGSVINATGDVIVETFANDTPGQALDDQIQGIDPTTGTLTFRQSGLSDGDLVQFQPNGHPISTPTGNLDSSRTYRTVVTGSDTLKLGASFPATITNAVPGAPVAGVGPTKNVIVFAGPDQFKTGDAVHYDTNGGGSISSGLNTTGTYYVRTIGPDAIGNTIKLYPTLAAATAPFKSFDPTVKVSGSTFLFNDLGFQNGDKVTYQGPAPLTFTTGGLKNGNQIQVASTSGLQTGDKVTYQTNAPAGTLPITELVNGGTYYVIVVDSTTLELDPVSKADAQGANPTILSLTAGPNGGQITELLQQQSIGNLVNGNTYFVVGATAGTFQLSTVFNGSPIPLDVSQTSGVHQIGFDGIAFDNLANANGTQDIYLAITGPATTGPNGAKLFAAGGVSLRALQPPVGSGVTNATADGGSFAGGAFPFPSASASLSPVVQASIDATTVNAGGNVTILASATQSVGANANNGSGGVIEIGEASASATYNGTTKAFVGATNDGNIDATGVTIQAGGNVQIASSEDVTTNVNVESNGGGGISSGDAEATSTVNTNTVAAVGANANVTGQTVSISAINPSYNLNTNATVNVFALGAAATANTFHNVSGSALVHIYPGANITGNQGVDVIANNNNFPDNQNPDTTNVSLTFFLSFGGPHLNANFTANVTADAGATVTAGPRPIGSPLVSQAGFATLALFVSATDTNFKRSSSESRTVVWNANVNLTDGAAPAPVLIIGPNGNITQATGLSAQIVGNTVVVNSLAGVSAGEALFIGTDSVSNTANNPYPVFNIRNSYQTVTILNQSSLNLEVQNIGMASQSPLASPQVQIEAKGATNTNIPFFFTLGNNSSLPVLDIENQNASQTPSNIIIAGLLNNPTGQTIIANPRGDIVSTGPSAIVRANGLGLTASGNIGTSTNRINADLVEFTNPRTSVLMVPTLTATATNGNDYLALTPRQADTSAGPASVLINSLGAGQLVDVTMQQATTIQEPGTFFPGVLVAVENLPGGTLTQDTYYAFFHPDTVAHPATLPGNPPLKSVVGNYTINAITAGGNVTLNVVQASDTATVPGVIQSTTGGLTKNGAGLLVLNGPSPNLYSGVTTVNGGTLNLAKTTGPAVPGDLVANSGTIVNLQANNQTAPTTNVTLNGATFNVGSIPSPGVTDSIATLTLNAGTVQIGTGGVLKLNGNVTVGGSSNSTISGAGSLDLNGGVRTFTVSSAQTLTISTPVIGAAGSGLTFTGGTLTFSGTATNTYQGITSVLNGTLNLTSTGVSIPGNLVIGDGIGAAGSAWVNAVKPFDIADISVVTINSDGELNLNNTSQSIAGLIGTGKVMGGTGTLTNTLTVKVPASTTYTFAGVISGTGLAFTKAGAGIQVLSGINTYTGTTSINAGELEVDGQIGNGQVNVKSGGILGGTGTITGTTEVKAGGEVDPGSAGGGIGTLNVSILKFDTDSIYKVDVGLSAAGAVINDDLNGGKITIQTGGTAQLQFSPFAGFNGLTLDIAHSTVAYGGLFAFGATPLVEGGTYKIGPTPYQITYVGAPGHDVILTAHLVTDVWTGAGNNSNWSNPQNWAGNAVPKAGDALQFPANAMRKFNINDLPAGFEVGEIDFTGTGGGYSISGNAITLDGGVQDSATDMETIGLDSTVNFTTFWINSGTSGFTDSAPIHLGSVTLYVSDIAAASSTTFTGAITGANANVVKVGAGALTYNGANSNTYGGTTSVLAGSLNLRKSNPATAISGPLVIGDGVGGPNADLVNIVFDNQISDTVPITVNSSGELNFGTSLDTIGNLTLNGGTAVVNPVLGGIQLDGNVTVNQSTTIGQRINLIGAGPHLFTVAAGATLTVNGQINGTGASLTKAGLGTLTLTGTTEDLYTGTTTVTAGTLNLSKTGVIAIAGPLVVGDGTNVATVNYTGPNQVGDAQPITVNANSTVNMNGFTDEVGALTLNGGTIAIGAGGTLTTNGNITASGNSSLTGGTLYIKEVSRTVSVASGGTLTLNAAITSIFGAGITKTGTGTLVLGGANTFTGATTVNSGRLLLTGGSLAGPLTISSGGTLTGSGATSSITFASGSAFSANIGAGGANLVSSTGAINLAGATLNVVLGTLPAINQTFTILSSQTQITGTFAGLADNATFVVNGHMFRINYSPFNTVFLTYLG